MASLISRARQLSKIHRGVPPAHRSDGGAASTAKGFVIGKAASMREDTHPEGGCGGALLAGKLHRAGDPIVATIPSTITRQP